MQPDLLTEKDAAKYLGMSVKTLQMWRSLSKPPVYLKLGRSVRYRPEDLDEFLKIKSVKPFSN